MYDLVAVGNPVYDLIVTPKIATKNRILSGCSTNACLAARKLGMTRVALIGTIGKDFVETFYNDLRYRGIEPCIVRLSEQTGGFRLVYDERGDRTLDVLGIAEQIHFEDIPAKYLDTKYFVLGPVLGEIDRNLIKSLRESTRAKIFLDPQGLVRRVGRSGRIEHSCDRLEMREIMGLVDFVKPNEHEGEVITGEQEPLRCLETLAEMRDGPTILTLAERGSLLFDGEAYWRIMAYRTVALDPTGAGDVYAGSFLFEYDRVRRLVEACSFASAAASIMVENIGPDFPLTCEEAYRRKVAVGNARIT
jgi:sugar/nucleoside kinase (ribokinase family)